MLLGLGGIATAAPALASASVVAVSDGQISGKGTAVSGTYTVTCSFFDENINITMELRQRTGKTVNSTSFYDSFQCAGDGVPVTRPYIFAGSSTIFKQGVATITGIANGNVCCYYSVNEVINEESQLLK